MDIRKITDTYHVSPQIDPADAPALKAAGYALVICNRPDGEVPPPLQSAAMAEAMAEAGLRFETLPIVHSALGPELAAQQAALAAGATGPVLAYCASGTRSTVVWALGQVGHRAPEDILEAAARAGYDLSGLRGALGAQGT